MSKYIYNKDLYGRTGDTKLPLKFQFKDANGSIMNISSYKFYITVTSGEGITPVIVEDYYYKGSSNNKGLTIESNNTLVWKFNGTDNVLLLAPGEYRYGMKVTNSSNETKTIMQGVFLVEKEIVNVK